MTQVILNKILKISPKKDVGVKLCVRRICFLHHFKNADFFCGRSVFCVGNIIHYLFRKRRTCICEGRL